MNKKTIILIAFAIIFFSITIILYVKVLKPDIYKLKEQNKKYNGDTTVDIVMSTVAPTGASVLVENRTEFIKLHNKYKIQKKSFNNWKDFDIITSNDKLSYNIDLYEFQYKPISIFTIDWSNLYGTLQNGIYRIVLYDYDSGNELYSNEFKLPKVTVDKPTLKNEKDPERYINVTLDALVSTATPTGIRITNYGQKWNR